MLTPLEQPWKKPLCLHRYDPPQLSGADADAGLMCADEIHPVQDLNMRDTANGTPVGIHDNLRTVEVNKAAEARVHCDYLAFIDIGGGKNWQAVNLKTVQHQLTA